MLLFFVKYLNLFSIEYYYNLLCRDNINSINIGILIIVVRIFIGMMVFGISILDKNDVRDRINVLYIVVFGISKWWFLFSNNCVIWGLINFIKLIVFIKYIVKVFKIDIWVIISIWMCGMFKFRFIICVLLVCIIVIIYMCCILKGKIMLI